MLSIGDVLNARYRIDRMLEIGALESQYQGWDLETHTSVIIKELMPQPELDAETYSDLQQAFERDADALSALNHPHIAATLDAFCVAPTEAREQSTELDAEIKAYLILQAVAGQSLADLIARESTVPEARIVRWAGQLLEALAYAHERGVYHRDIKPANIVITPNDQALLTNFEIIALWNPHDPRMWTAKRVMGVPDYAPPEDWGMKTSQIDHRSDLYSLGATLYHALTGEQPITAGERTSNPYRFLQVKALNPRVSSGTKAAILKAIELPRDKRFQSATEMARALESEDPRQPARVKPPPAPFLPLSPPKAWPRLVGLAVSSMVLFAAGLLGLWLNQEIVAPRQARMSTPAPQIAAVPATTARPSEAANSEEVGLAIQPDPQADIMEVATATPSPPPTPPTVDPSVGGAQPPAGWALRIEETFSDNANNWIESEHEDDWGSIVRRVTGGAYRWEIEALRAVGRWSIPQLEEEQGKVGDVYVSVEAQRVSGPETAAYGLILRHSEGAYYLYSVRDDGYYQFSLWTGFAWQPVIDWTPTTGVRSGDANRLTAIGRGQSFELYINGRLVAEAEDEQLTRGDTGLSISTAATEGQAVFVFDNFEVWAP